MADVREELMATLTALADFSYGWGLLDAYLPRLQAAVSAPGFALQQHVLPWLPTQDSDKASMRIP